MKLAMSFTLRGALDCSMRRLELPMEVELPRHGRFGIKWSSEVLDGEYTALPHLTPAADFLFVLGECQVEPSRMEAIDDGFGPGKAVFAPEADDLTDGTFRLGGALTYVTGVGLETSVFMGLEDFNRLIPEGRADEERLRELKTVRAALPLLGSRGVEPFDNVPVTADFLGALAQSPGIGLYPDVLKATSPAVRFRELWRILEFAFQAHGRELVDLLGEFPPAQDLGFERGELDTLLVLRGRLSHAASREGIAELGRTQQDAIESLGRLWSLVDAVLLAKKDASRNLAVQEIQPLAAFIAQDGSIETTAAVADSADWLESWGLHSPRFR